VTGIGFPFEASVSPLQEATFRISPALLGAGFLFGALALLGLAAALVASLLRREPETLEADAAPELTPLERALEHVEWSKERPEAERREALEALAVELDTEGSDLTNATRRLAWSPSAPSPEAMDALVESVREADGTPD
jgi:hypothetical protein